MVLACCWLWYLGFPSGSTERPPRTGYRSVRYLSCQPSSQQSNISWCSGITTVLTMTFMGLEARKDLPKVTYPTALDYFVFISFMYIFCTVVQVSQDIAEQHLNWSVSKFGLVHHFTKMGSGEYYLEELENEICRRNDLDKSEKKRYRKSSSYSLTKTVRY